MIKGKNVRKLKIKQISLAVCLALMPFSGFAAGLGKLNVSSGLGEPLKAEIELLSVSPEELSTLVAAIASEEAYATQGITRLGIHNSIKVEVAKAGDGSPILKLRSNQPISDPYLDMLIQVDWASGRLQREYTVLLDPPGYKQLPENAAPMIVTPPSTAQSNNAMNSSVMDEKQGITRKLKKSRRNPNSVIPTNSSKSSTAQMSAENSTDNVQSNTDQTLTTKRGDTLSSIAKQMQMEGVNLDQMLVGLYENNKEAFTSGNMNRLKVGQIIKVPSKESLTSIGAKQVAQSVKAHSSNWSAYRNALAGVVAASPAMETSEQKQTSSGKVETAEDKATPAKVGPQDVVKLSAGEKGIGKVGNDASKLSEAKIIALQEETTTRSKSLKEAQDKTAALETQIEDLKKLLALKSQSLATVQKNSEAAANLPDAKAADPKVEVKPEEKPADVVSAPEAQKSETAPLETVKLNDVAEVTADKAPVPIVLPPVVKKITPPQPESAVEPSFLQSLLNSVDLTVLGAVGGVALLGAGWMFLRNKRRKDLDSFERGILTSGGLRANTVFGNTTGNASNSDTSFLTDFAQSADGSMIDTNDVDPIAEAEVYMAYGRDAQAEEILKDAISKEPKRYELHLKLLEMYATRKDASAFEAIAGELYTTLGVNDPIWAKVAEIGHNMEPENPLYDVSKSGAASDLASPKLDGPDFSSLPATTDLDFSLDDHSTHDNLLAEDDTNSVVMQSFSSLQNVEQEMSFDLGSIEKGSLESENSLNSPQNNTQSDNTINFNSDADSSLDFDLREFNMDAELVGSPSVPDEPLIIDNIDFASSEITSHEFSSPDLDFSKKEVLANPTISAQLVDSNTLDFDMDFSAFSAPVIETAESNLPATAPNDIVFDFDLPSEAVVDSVVTSSELADANTVSEISFDLPSFDPTVDEDYPLESTPLISVENEVEANTFDLSSISLDLDDSVTEKSLDEPILAASAPAFEDSKSGLTLPSVTTIEPPDVDIKLDLVAAYIDMDDKEGAKELLDEVMKEGGVKQQLRAQQMLNNLA